MLTIIDEYTRECLAIDVAQRLRSDDVLYRLAALSSIVARRTTSARIMVPSSPPRPSVSGWRGSV